MTLVIDYDLVIDPPILEDEGGFKVSFEKLTFESYIQPFLENEGTPEQRFQVNVNDVNFVLKSSDLNLSLNNTNDFD